METQVSLSLEKWLSVILWMCASSGHRLPRQIGAIGLLSTSMEEWPHWRWVLEWWERIHSPITVSALPRFLDPWFGPCRGGRQSAQECFCKHCPSDSPSSVKNEDTLDPSSACAIVDWFSTVRQVLVKCHCAVEGGFYGPTCASEHIQAKGDFPCCLIREGVVQSRARKDL